MQLVLRILVHVPASNCVDVCWSDTQSFYQRGLKSYMAIEWRLSEKSIDGRQHLSHVNAITFTSIVRYVAAVIKC